MKKIALIAAVALALPLVATAQTTATTAKAPAKKAASKKSTAKKAAPVEAKDDDVTLTPKDMAVAERVLTGTIKCELGASVRMEADANKPGFFTLTHNKVSYHMHPVDSRVGAIRLEDTRAQAVWLQLGNKSMLMSEKLGQRLADECQIGPQIAVAEELKRNPPPSLFGDAPNK